MFCSSIQQLLFTLDYATAFGNPMTYFTLAAYSRTRRSPCNEHPWSSTTALLHHTTRRSSTHNVFRKTRAERGRLQHYSQVPKSVSPAGVLVAPHGAPFTDPTLSQSHYNQPPMNLMASPFPPPTSYFGYMLVRWLLGIYSPRRHFCNQYTRPR